MRPPPRALALLRGADFDRAAPLGNQLLPYLVRVRHEVLVELGRGVAIVAAPLDLRVPIVWLRRIAAVLGLGGGKPRVRGLGSARASGWGVSSWPFACGHTYVPFAGEAFVCENEQEPNAGEIVFAVFSRKLTF